LRELCLYNFFVHGKDFQSLQLEVLRLDSCVFNESSNLFSLLAGSCASSLRILSLWRSSFDESDSLFELAKLHKLQELNIGGLNQTCNELLFSLSKSLSLLETLNISMCRVSNQGENYNLIWKTHDFIELNLKHDWSEKQRFFEDV
jgi:hypothetical protein